MKVTHYTRIENGTKATITAAEALAEINHAMMDGRDDIHTMSASGRPCRAHIEYVDGRVVDLAPTTTPEPAAAAPEWRTLKGVEAPFRVHCGTATDRAGNPRLFPSGDRKAPTGEAITIVRAEYDGSTRTGWTADGRAVYFGGAATRTWITPGA